MLVQVWMYGIAWHEYPATGGVVAPRGTSAGNADMPCVSWYNGCKYSTYARRGDAPSERET